MMGRDLAGAQRVGDRDVEVGPDEGKVVVPAVPDDDVGFPLGRREDRGIVDACEHQVAERKMRLVFLPLLDGALGGIEIGQRREALHALFDEISVGHGMPKHGDAPAGLAESTRRPARDRRLPATRPHGGDGEHGERRPQHRAPRPEEREIGARGECARAKVHHLLMRDVAVGEDDLLDLPITAEGVQLRLVDDRNALGIKHAGELRRIAAAADAGNLRSGERDHLPRRVVAVDDVEVVEVAAGGAEDDDAPTRGCNGRRGPPRFRCSRFGLERSH